MKSIYFIALILSVLIYSCKDSSNSVTNPSSSSDTLCYKDSISLYVPYTGYINPGTDTIYTVMDYKKLNKNNVNLSFHLETDSNVAVDSVYHKFGFDFKTHTPPIIYNKYFDLDLKKYDTTFIFSIILNTSDSICLSFNLQIGGYIGKNSHQTSFTKIKDILLE